MMTARTAVRCVGCGLWKAHRAVRDCTMIDGAGRRRAPRCEPRDRAATHRPARGTPRGADVRKAPIGLPPDGCGRGGPRICEPDGSVVAPAGDAGLRSRPE